MTGSSETPLVTVVTPFYNSADFLAECIESVLRQTYTNFEYILLDNCSTDRSAEIVQRYADRDPRIRFVRATEFVGQVPNYNRALRLLSAESRYTKMVQADDWIYPNCLQEMVACAESDPGIDVVGSYSMYGGHIGHQTIPYRESGVFSGAEAARAHLKYAESFLGSPTCVMYRSSAVRAHDPFYVENSPCEDVDACFELFRTGSFGFVYQILSFNRRDNESFWSRMSAYRPILLHHVYLVHTFGPSFYEPREQRRLVYRAERAMYAFLGRRAVRGADAKLWEFYKEGLASAGLTLDRTRVALHAMKYVGRTVGNVWDFVRKLTRGIL
jgi:glycosyltransferase involved in cell wall biosynthesis